MRIAFLGDSLTEGRPGESFLARLRVLLPGDELLNHGRAGDTVPALLARLEHTALEPVDLDVLWIGVNDAFLGDWYLPPLDDLASGGAVAAGDVSGPAAGDVSGPAAHPLRPLYDRILDLALAHSPLAVCVPPVLPDPFDEGGISERVAGIGAMVAAAAAARGPRARLFDLAPAFAAAAAHASPGFTIDGVHLGARGADVVAAAFRDLIVTVRGEPPGPA
jgi:lysophospholipase L1-like esterase